MNRLFCLWLFLLVLASCIPKPSRQTNEKNILGDWIKARPHYKHDSKLVTPPPSELPIAGFSFYANHTFDNKVGFYNDNSSEAKMYEAISFLGTSSKFKITADSLSLFDLSSKKWENFEVVKLTPDSLKIKNNDAMSTYIRLHLRKNNNPRFDEIILSTSGCFGICPISNTIIKADGAVIFKGQHYTTRKGLFTGKVSKEEFQQLQDNFRKTDFDSLKNNYRARWTDDETTTTTFVKDGKIYKTVSDYGRKAPYLFTWAYTPFQFLYQAIQLKDVSYPGFIPRFDVFSGGELKKGAMVLDLQQSEIFLLFDYLRKAKLSKVQFKRRFKLHTYFNSKGSYDINTDGRYYTFLVKGKPVTIDIGFNFYDVNAKNWQWRKAGEYD